MTLDEFAECYNSQYLNSSEKLKTHANRITPSGIASAYYTSTKDNIRDSLPK